MKNGLFKKWLAAALYVVALGSTAALAEPDSFGLGSGRDNALTVSTAGTIINSYAQVTGPLGPGATSIPVGACMGASACFAAGDLIMVLQTTGLVPEPASGVTSLIKLDTDYKQVGRWEFARLASVSGTTLTLTAPLVHDYAANVTQVIRVPEYTDVTINATRSITAPAWDGNTGGVVAFLAQGGITNNGSIDANAIGFRGGRFVVDSSGGTGCSGLDEPAPQGAQKGEGLASTRYGDAHTGRGNVANGGGGGVCYKSGGGGGGNGGVGGNGGNSGDDNRPVGGMGGAAVEGSLLSRLTFGGGGGVGHGDSGINVPGGRGGGIIFVRANQLSGTGSISAGGESVGVAASNASSGGGAGGTLYLRFASSATCGASNLGARGGIGGNSGLGLVGPGGGGGGGRILLQSASGTCNVGSSNAGGANAGTQQDATAPGGGNYGAQAGLGGATSRLNTGFPVALPAPTVTEPANGTSTNNRRPDIRGTAQANTTVVIYLDGVEIGRATSNAAGAYVFSPSADLADKTYTVQAAIEVEGVQSPKSAANTFTVDTKAPKAVIVSGPPSLSNSRSAAFDFDVAEPDTGVTYECRLSPATTFTSCADPANLTVPADGTYSLEVRARDAAGNVGPSSAPYSWTVDTLPPEVPVVESPAQNGTVDTPTPVISGSAEPNSTVTIIIDGQVVGTTRTDTSGTWSYTPTTPLTPGSHEVQVRATDEAGNTAASAPHTFTVIQEPADTGGDIAFLGDGLGCSATGGDSSLVLMGLGTFLALARRRRRD